MVDTKCYIVTIIVSGHEESEDNIKEIEKVFDNKKDAYTYAILEIIENNSFYELDLNEVEINEIVSEIKSYTDMVKLYTYLQDLYENIKLSFYEMEPIIKWYEVKEFEVEDTNDNLHEKLINEINKLTACVTDELSDELPDDTPKNTIANSVAGIPYMRGSGPARRS